MKTVYFTEPTKENIEGITPMKFFLEPGTDIKKVISDINSIFTAQGILLYLERSIRLKYNQR